MIMTEDTAVAEEVPYLYTLLILPVLQVVHALARVPVPALVQEADALVVQKKTSIKQI